MSSVSVVQDPTSGTFEGTSGTVSVGTATQAGSHVLLLLGLIGDNTTARSIAQPTGFLPFGDLNFPNAIHYGRVIMWVKPDAAAGETSWDVTVVNGPARVMWTVLELDGADLDWPTYNTYLAANSGATITPLAVFTTGPTSQESYDAIALSVTCLVDPAGTVPTVTARSNEFIEIASQTGVDSSSRAGRLTVAMRTLNAVMAPISRVDFSPNSYGRQYVVVVTAKNALHAPHPLALSGAEIGTGTNLATRGAADVLQLNYRGNLAPWDEVVGTPAVISGGRSGEYCYELSSTSAAENLAWKEGELRFNLGIDAIETLVERLHVYFPTALPSVNTELWSSETGVAGERAVLRYVAASQRFGMRIGSGTEVLSDAAPTHSQWIGVDLRHDVRDTTHTVEWAVDYNANTSDTARAEAQTSVSASGLTAYESTGNGIGTVRHGWTDAITATVRVDDIMCSRYRKNYPIGDIRVLPLKVDSGGTITATDAAKFRVMTNGTYASFTSAAAVTALRTYPPTAATGVAQITDSTTDYIRVPFETFQCSPNFVALAARWHWAGYAVSGNPTYLMWRVGDTSTPLSFGGSTSLGPPASLVDSGFDATTLVWQGIMHQPDANQSYVLTQPKIDALYADFGFSGDTNPDPAAKGPKIELAVQPSVILSVFGEPGQVPRVEGAYDPISGGVLAFYAYTAAGESLTLTWYDGAGTPHEVSVPGGSNPYTVLVEAADIPSAPRVELRFP